MIKFQYFVDRYNSLDGGQKFRFHTLLLSSMSLLVESLSYKDEKASADELKYLIDKAFERAEQE